MLSVYNTISQEYKKYNAYNKKQSKNKVKIKVILGENESLRDYHIFKYNTEKPNTAYELDDGTGRYLWKNFKEDHEYDIDSDISKYSFTNNAHYINQNIVFYLQIRTVRQSNICLKLLYRVLLFF
jgi:hypothetical protein